MDAEILKNSKSSDSLNSNILNSGTIIHIDSSCSLAQEAILRDRIKLANNNSYVPDLSNYALKDDPNRPASLLLPEVLVHRRDSLGRHSYPITSMEQEQLKRNSIQLPVINMASILSSLPDQPFQSVDNNICNNNNKVVAIASSDSNTFITQQQNQRSSLLRQSFNGYSINNEFIIKINDNNSSDDIVSNSPNRNQQLLTRSSFNSFYLNQAMIGHPPLIDQKSISTTTTTTTISTTPKARNSILRSSFNSFNSNSSSKSQHVSFIDTTPMSIIETKTTTRKSSIRTSSNSSPNQVQSSNLSPIVFSSSSLPIIQALQKKL